MGLFQKAVRWLSKICMALCGPSGSGKTYCAILIARGLVGPQGRIALIDTERGSGALYAHLTDYDIATLDGNYDPANYIRLIKEAEAAGYDCIIIDSLSHAWEGEGGILSKHDLAAKRTMNSFTAWRDVTPQHNALVDAILQCKCHVIVTMRTKTHYDMVEEQGANGRTVIKPVKVGLKPVQREGMDYEFTLVFDLTQDGHVATASKDRTGLFDGKPHVPGLETGQRIAEWHKSADVIELHPPKPQPAFQTTAVQPANAPSLKVRFDTVIRGLQDQVNAALGAAGLLPIYDLQRYRVEIGEWIRQSPEGQLTPDLLARVQAGESAFITDFVLFQLNKNQPAEEAV